MTCVEMSADPLQEINGAVRRCQRYKSKLKATGLSSWRNLVQELSTMSRAQHRADLAPQALRIERWTAWAASGSREYASLMEVVLDAAHGCVGVALSSAAASAVAA